MQDDSRPGLGAVFVDTSAFKAVYDTRDDYHMEARDFMDVLATKKVHIGGLVTSDYVLDETLTILRFAAGHQDAATFAGAVLGSKAFRIVYLGESGFTQSLELFLRSKDKMWSFTDCSSFALMKHLGIRSAFTFDPHFEQAGYQILPRTSRR